MYKVYSLNECDQWNEYYNRIHHNDIYYKMEFFRAFEKFEGSQAFLFIYEEGSDLVYYPFFKRVIEDSPYFDITSQYTYGGPLFNFSEDNKDFVFNFRNAFGIFCKENHIVSEFIRFHPFIKNNLLLEGFVDIKCVNEGIYMDLNQTIDQIKNGYHQKVRWQINKAIRNGFNIIFSNNIKDLDLFFPIYKHTLQRNNADSNHYFLNQDLLKLLINELRDNFEFIFIEKEGIYVSTELVLFTDKYAHGVIGGTLNEFFDEHPHRLLRHALTVSYLDKKQTKLILGSGGHRGDGIFEYKKRFNPRGIYELYMGQKIHDLAKYDELVEQLKRKQRDKELNLNFFPLYRS